ncbi:hypothetical protein HanIR_Chr06g0298631 [Helianthus annuus]|nr:hypothetical protein HanIR_Chr06g0298631 [Helianthus annuus]
MFFNLDEGCWSWNLLELDARFSERILFVTFLSFCKTVTFCPVISIITPTSFINGKGENTRKFNTTKTMSQPLRISLVREVFVVYTHICPC